MNIICIAIEFGIKMNYFGVNAIRRSFYIKSGMYQILIRTRNFAFLYEHIFESFECKQTNAFELIALLIEIIKHFKLAHIHFNTGLPVIVSIDGHLLSSSKDWA